MPLSQPWLQMILLTNERNAMCFSSFLDILSLSKAERRDAAARGGLYLSGTLCTEGSQAWGRTGWSKPDKAWLI